MVNFHLPNQLPKRKNFKDTWSESLDFGRKNNSIKPTWVPEIQLVKNLDKYCKYDNTFNEYIQAEDVVNIVRYFLEVATENLPKRNWELDTRKYLARKHIIRGFEEDCYQAVKNRCRAWKNFENPIDTFNNYWEIGISILSNIEKMTTILNSYDIDRTQNIRNYLQSILTLQIRDEFYKKTGQGKRTIWGSLKIETKTNMRLALKDFGLNDSLIEKYLLAREIFFQVYQSIGKGKQRRFVEPEDKDFQNTAKLYNEIIQSEHRKNELLSSEVVSDMEIQKWLQDSIAALQRFLTKNNDIISLDDVQPEDNEFNHKHLEILKKIDDNKIKEQEAFERQQQEQNIVKEHLDRFLENIKNRSDNIYMVIILRYGLDLDQKSTEDLLRSNHIEMDQSKISRSLKKARIELLDILFEEFKNELKILASVSDTENFDKQIKIWKDQKQKEIEAGLKDYLKQAIETEINDLIKKSPPENSHVNPEILFRMSLNQWIWDNINISIELDNLPQSLPELTRNKIENKLQKIIEYNPENLS